MRIAHLSDLHITEGPHLDDHRETLSRIVQAALACNPHLWLLTGDFYGRTVPHRSTPRERAVLYPLVRQMAETGPVVVLYGNHDFDPDLDSMALLGGRWPVYVVKVAESFRVVTPAGPARLWAIPYPAKKWLLAGEEKAPGVLQGQATAASKLSMLLSLWTARIQAARVATRRDGFCEPHIFTAHAQVCGGRTSGGEVLAGQEIEIGQADLAMMGVDYGALGHLHLRQEPALRCWYPGSPWMNDHGEAKDIKGWHLVDIDTGDGIDPEPMDGEEPMAWDGVDYEGLQDGRARVRVLLMGSSCRRFLTLDWSWGMGDDGRPRWLVEPAAGEWEHQVPGAIVRARIEIAQDCAAACPWEQVEQAIRALDPYRLTIERRQVGRLRVRAPTVAKATSIDDKLQALWSLQEPAPSAVEQEQALRLLQRLRTEDDQSIGQTWAG